MYKSSTNDKTLEKDETKGQQAKAGKFDIDTSNAPEEFQAFLKVFEIPHPKHSTLERGEPLTLAQLQKYRKNPIAGLGKLDEITYARPRDIMFFRLYQFNLEHPLAKREAPLPKEYYISFIINVLNALGVPDAFIKKATEEFGKILNLTPINRDNAFVDLIAKAKILFERIAGDRPDKKESFVAMALASLEFEAIQLHYTSRNDPEYITKEDEYTALIIKSTNVLNNEAVAATPGSTVTPFSFMKQPLPGDFKSDSPTSEVASHKELYFIALADRLVLLAIFMSSYSIYRKQKKENLNKKAAYGKLKCIHDGLHDDIIKFIQENRAEIFRVIRNGGVREIATSVPSETSESKSVYVVVRQLAEHNVLMEIPEMVRAKRDKDSQEQEDEYVKKFTAQMKETLVMHVEKYIEVVLPHILRTKEFERAKKVVEEREAAQRKEALKKEEAQKEQAQSQRPKSPPHLPTPRP